MSIGVACRFRCARCSQVLDKAQKSNGRYFVKCSECGYWVDISQSLFDYAQRHMVT
jgi:DNA-directed RNA polymerase subunit M/transcription elongation factor TFIIS